MNKDEIARNEVVEVMSGLTSTIRLTPDGEGDLQVELVGEHGAIMLLGEADNKKPRREGNGVDSSDWLRGRATTDTDIHYKSLSEMEQSALGSF